MGLWIESHCDLEAHHKLGRLRRALGVSRPTAIGHLHMLWHWAAANSEDGDLSKLTPDDIAFIVDWEGEPDVLVSGLIAAGFVDADLRLHDWREYFGKMVEARAKARERVARGRANAAARYANVRVTDANSTVTPPNEPATDANVRVSSGVDLDLNRDLDLDLDLDRNQNQSKAKSKAVEGPSAPSRTRMTPPTQDEVEEYWFTKSLEGDALDFWLHWQGHGWRFGNGAPMKDWHATAQRWSREEVKRRAEANARQAAPAAKRPAGTEPMDNSSEAVLARLRANMEKGGLLNP